MTLKAGTAGKVREKVAEIRVLSRGSDVKGAIENRRENSRFTLITHLQEIRGLGYASPSAMLD